MNQPLTHRNPNLDPLLLPLHGSALIEASAGTGKTFTIALLYVRLVLGHGQLADSPLARGLLPPNVLVVTFTDAATKELRDRIRSRLTQAAAVFSDSDGGTALSAETALLYQFRTAHYPDPATWPDCRKKLLLAAEWMDEAAVSTIHAFCNRMLSEHAFDSGSLFKLTLSTDQSELLDQVVRDYWRTFIYPLNSTDSDLLLGWWKTPEELSKACRNLLGDESVTDTGHNDPAMLLHQAAEQKYARLQVLKAEWRSWCDELGLLIEATQNFKKPADKKIGGHQANTIMSVIEHLRAWCHSDEECPKGLLEKGTKRPKGYYYLSKEGMAEVWKAAEPFEVHPAMEAINVLPEQLSALPCGKSSILRHATHWITNRLESEKQQRSEMGFDDLLTRLDDALNGPRGDQLAATIRRQFPVALIDEFQDTDPLQYRIFDRIYRVASNDPETCLLMIGDPKQAIYGFRGADIYTYLHARQSARARTYTLSQNFRSSISMVEAVNRVFEHADQHSRNGAFLFGNGEVSSLPFQRVSAHGTERQWSVSGAQQPSLVFWTQETQDKDKDGKPKPLTKEAVAAAVAESCASEIARLLTLGQSRQAGFVRPEQPADISPVEPGDIAILVNNRNEAAAVRDALRRRRIKSVYLSDRDSVLTSQEATDMLCWLQAFSEPRQLARIRAALATPTLGLGWQRLDQLLTDEQVLEHEIKRFMGYLEQWQQQGVLPMLRTFLMDFDVPGRLLRRADGERRLTDILHIAELLQQDSLQRDGEYALVHHFTQILRAADSEDEHRTLRLESDAGLVKVITVHKSKGLEYPLVFLPFGTAFRAESDKQAYVRYHDQDGQLVTVFDPSADDLANADEERLGEDIRKLYVALTRARYAVWVGVSAIMNWHNSGLGYLLASSPGANIADCLRPLVDGSDDMVAEPLPEPSDQHYNAPTPETLGPALTVERQAREDWWIASYSAIEYAGLANSGIDYQGEPEDAQSQNLQEESAQADHDDTASFDAPQGPHQFPRGAGPGTFLHDILEWCARQGFAQLLAQPQRLREQLNRRCQRRGWQVWAEPLEDWLVALMSTPIPLDPADTQRASLADVGSLHPELEFWFESCDVDTRKLDRIVTTQTFNQADRPMAKQTRFNGMLKGFIDVVFEHQGKYYVLDYKSNSLGNGDMDYTRQAMAEAILDKRYDLQYLLYLLALHRLLKSRLPDYDYDQHVGGAIYLFLRGIHGPNAGSFADKPPRQLIEQLDALFDGDADGEAAA